MKRLLKNHFWLILLVLISFISLLDFLHPGLPLTHDGKDHVARIANFYQNLIEGNLIPRWAGNLNWGYGHPVLMFLYPLPSYVASFFHFFSLGLVDSVKISFALSFILSGVFMYLWIKEIWGEKAGFVAGIVYMFAPYRFVDLYVRGAIGECWGFVWPALICYFLLKKNYLGIAMGVALLILSHNALSLMFFIPILCYLCYLSFLENTTRKKILFAIRYSLSAIFGFLLSAFFWIPAIFEAKYTLRDIVTKNNLGGFESIERLLFSAWSYGGSGNFSVQLGILQWLMIAVIPFLILFLIKRKEKTWIFIFLLFCSFVFSLLMILPIFAPFSIIIPFVNKFQFSWRWLSLAVFPPAVFAGLLIYLMPQRIKLFAVVFILLVVFVLNKDYWHAYSFLSKPESYYTSVYYGTTDTGESAPVWSVRFMEKEAVGHLEVVDGKAEIKEIERKSTKHVYNIETNSKSRLRENTLYFPGWEVLVDGKSVDVEFQDEKNRGLITFYIEKGSHKVEILFKETKLRIVADLISALSFLSILGYLGFRRMKK